jgi:hypothetical protein
LAGLCAAPRFNFLVSIAKIRGCTRGIGDEFVLGCDMR